MTLVGYICTCFNHKDYKEVGVFFNASRMLVLQCLSRYLRFSLGVEQANTFYLEYSFNQKMEVTGNIFLYKVTGIHKGESYTHSHAFNSLKIKIMFN